MGRTNLDYKSDKLKKGAFHLKIYTIYSNNTINKTQYIEGVNVGKNN